MGAWALGEPRTHIAGLTGLHSANGPLEGKTVGVMLRLTPIEDPKTWEEEAGKTPPAHPKGKKTRGGRKDDLRSYITT